MCDDVFKNILGTEFPFYWDCNMGLSNVQFYTVAYSSKSKSAQGPAIKVLLFWYINCS